jgi:thiol-disulfide isomerase/thioredoxin
LQCATWRADCSSRRRRQFTKKRIGALEALVRSRSVAALSAALILSAFAGAATSSNANSPELRLQRLDGAAFSLDALRGNLVVLDFWASWCVPCRTSFPYLDQLQTRYSAKGVRVVGLTLEEDSDAVNAFLDQVPVAFAIARDPSGRAGETFGVVAMPTTFLLDREGRVAARFEGGDAKAHAKLDAAIETLLAGKTLPPGSDRRVGAGLEATGAVKAWQRGYLADPFMNLDGDPITRQLREHIHASKEGAAGDGGAAGGGCGCN